MGFFERDIKLLDCTLRDGGYVNDNDFGRGNIKKIITGLKASGVDLIEYGYLEDKKPVTDGKTEYRTFEDLFELTGDKKGNILMLLGEKYNIEELPPAPNDSCFLRISFHREHAGVGIEKIREVIKKGYKVYVQPTVTMSYSDDELEQMLRMCNELHPVSVAIVDTFGQMAPDDVEEKAKIFDGILDKDIAISFHAHNNLQNAYANAIRFMESVDKSRRIIIDVSIYGMGRGAGNLPTELMMNYLNKNYGKNYDIEPLLAVVDDVIMKIKEKNNWGYSLPYYLSGMYGVHPSYILAFMERKTQNSGDIKCLIDMISSDRRTEFDLEYAEELYNTYNNRALDDDGDKEKLKEMLRGKKILLVGPGKSLEKYKGEIGDYIDKNNPYVIGVNGKHGTRADAVFFSNKKRYGGTDLEKIDYTVLCTSNIDREKAKDCLVFNYEDYLAKEYGVSDNALLMLLNILRSIGVKKVVLAGFDGYDVEGNFYEESLELLLDRNYVDELNKTIRVNVEKIKDDMVIESITPSRNV